MIMIHHITSPVKVSHKILMKKFFVLFFRCSGLAKRPVLQYNKEDDTGKECFLWKRFA